MDHARVKAIARRLAKEKGWGSPRFIDAGNSAAVFEVDHPEHGSVALKVYDPKFFQGQNALIEVQRVKLQQQLCNHENDHLVKILSSGDIESANTWYILMEFCPWPTLERCLVSVPNEKIVGLIGKLAEAVIFLNERGLVHRDIKPANLAISPDFERIKLLDLGVLRKIDASEGNGTDGLEKKRFVATVQYSPPEYLLREEAEGEAGFIGINIYQVGAVLHDMIMKQPIFHQEAISGNRYLLARAVMLNIPKLQNADLPGRLLSLCRCALEKDPDKRTSGVTMQDFLRPFDTNEVLRRRISTTSPHATVLQMPSCLVWQARVEGWIRSAAIAEADTLGPQRLKRTTLAQGVEWTLTFPRCEFALKIEMLPQEEACALVVYFGITEPTAVSFQILAINADGIDQLDEDIIGLFRENILYLADLSSQPSD